MKAVLIVHNVVIEEQVNDALKSVGIDCYTSFTNVLGKGRLSEPHLDTEVWPGVNTGTLVVTDQPSAEKIMEKIRQMRIKLGTEGVKAFMWEIEDVT